jgi:hypothetical protein
MSVISYVNVSKAFFSKQIVTYILQNSKRSKNIGYLIPQTFFSNLIVTHTHTHTHTHIYI